MSKYYAVKGNGEKHLFTDWDSCKEFLDGKKGYKYKSFSSKKEAEFYFSDKDYAESLVAEDLKNGFAVAFTDGSYEENLGRYSFGAVVFSPDGAPELFATAEIIPILYLRGTLREKCLAFLRLLNGRF